MDGRKEREWRGPAILRAGEAYGRGQIRRIMKDQRGNVKPAANMFEMRGRELKKELGKGRSTARQKVLTPLTTKESRWKESPKREDQKREKMKGRESI